jgi:Ni2+-binding GTPase involved in maturation of urease and hydrogenase
MQQKARYVMIGGFLGAGKTTAILKLAEHLTAAGQRVGLITNDQSVGLVDTAMLASHGFPVEEITGGCFCCRFNSLVDAADKLAESARPEVFVAEPVGSCTDLKASVNYPLRRMYGDDFSVAPLSVVIDPVRALRVLGVEPGKAFSEKVRYVYDRQLAEAEIIVINKVDLLTPERLERLRAALGAAYPKARVVEVSARHGTGLEAWFGQIIGAEQAGGPAMDVDYEVYAAGEALLGWLNATVRLTADAPVDGNEVVWDLARRLGAKLGEAGAEVAHLKMTLTPEQGNDIAVINLTASDNDAELSHRLHGPVDGGELIVNLRAEADPGLLKSLATAALAETAGSVAGLRLEVEHLEHFRPGKPEPTHRMAVL